MKCLSLWQPWATPVVLGNKRNETRSWATSHRGWILIHAAKRRVWSEIEGYAQRKSWRAACGVRPQDDFHAALPFGAIIGAAKLAECIPTGLYAPAPLGRVQVMDGPTEYPGYSWTERQLGDYTPGRFAWVFSEAVAFHEPVPYRGMQGLFYTPFDLFVEGSVAWCAVGKPKPEGTTDG